MSPRQHFSAINRHVACLLFAAGLTSLLLWVAPMPVAAAAPDRAAAFSCADVSQIPEAECNALVALYDALQGQNWTVFEPHSPWLENDQPCTWEGVTCRDGRVVGLFPSGPLIGSIPPEIGDLSGLESLSMYNFDNLGCDDPTQCPGNLVGQIPAEIGNLTALREVLLGGGFTGTIPAEIGNLVSLEKLEFSGHFVGGSIPASIGNLTALKEARFGGLFGGPLPKQIGNLANLEVLSVQSGGTLPGPLPAELGNLTKLSALYIYGHISGPIPPSWGNLTNLTTADLQQSHITGSIPKELGNLTKLKTLYLNDNELEGPIPAELGNMSSLENLFLQSNHLTSVPAALGELPKLRGINLSDNAITEISANLFSLPGINLAHNRLAALPAGLDGNSPIAYIDLSYNYLTGPLPAEFGTFVELTTLNLGYNNLSGPLPAGMPNLTKLTTFYFEPTHLCIPSDPAFTTWLGGFNPNYVSQGVSCDTPVEPSAEFWHSPMTETLPYGFLGYFFPAELEFGELSTPDADAFAWDFGDGSTSDERNPSHTFSQPDTYTITLAVTYPSTVVSSSLTIDVVSRTTLCPYYTDYVPLDECIALVELWEVTDGANWTVSGNWPYASDPCTWYGVTCADPVTVAGGEQEAAVRRVTGLRLANNGLNGPLPASIGNLTALTVLDLSGNKLHVELPTSLQKLTSLDELSIDAAEVCLPPDSGLEAWLNGIPDGPEIASCTYLQLPVLVR